MDFDYRPGRFPLVVSIPHNGSAIPPHIAPTMTGAGRESRDTDWFLDRLYDLPVLAGCGLLVARTSRYVVDLNRPADGGSLYPGQTTTGLVPEECFDGTPIWAGGSPGAEETAARVREHWTPWHDCLAAELDRLRLEFGRVVLLDAHSIRSVLPRLFPGRLPDFNIGTNRGRSCSPAMLDAVMAVLRPLRNRSWVIDGRFVGGYITRHYGRPAEGIHAMQIELAQCNYLDEATGRWDDERARSVQPVLAGIVGALRKWVQS